jgi:CDP-diacylglycerol--serine O-phosphatidyltransferase
MRDEGFPTAADMITLFRAGLGFLALYLAALHDPFSAAPLLIFCMVLDGLDGEVARRLGTSHKLGHQLDAGADLICFCLAPAVFIYRMGGGESLPSGPDDPLIFPLVVSLALLVFGTIRLARFLRQERDLPYFSGLPTAALALLAICLLHPALAGYISVELTLLLVGLLSPVMVTRVPFPKLAGLPALVALAIFMTVAVDSSLEVWGPGQVFGAPGVALLLLAIGTYIFAGPLILLVRGAGGDTKADDIAYRGERHGK